MEPPGAPRQPPPAEKPVGTATRDAIAAVAAAASVRSMPPPPPRSPATPRNPTERRKQETHRAELRKNLLQGTGKPNEFKPPEEANMNDWYTAGNWMKTTRKWVGQYDQLCETRLTEPQKASMFGSRLGGLAAAWYAELELGDEFLTLEKVCELFMSRYCPLEEGVHEQAWEEIRCGRIKLGQPKRLTLISYMASFKDQVMKSGHKAGPHEELLRLFVDGIKEHSPSIAKEIHYDGIRRVKTLEEVYTRTLAIFSKEHLTGTPPLRGPTMARPQLANNP